MTDLLHTIVFVKRIYLLLRKKRGGHTYVISVQKRKREKEE